MNRRNFLRLSSLHVGALLIGNHGAVQALSATFPKQSIMTCELCRADNKVSLQLAAAHTDATPYCHNCGADFVQRSRTRSPVPSETSELQLREVKATDRYASHSNSRYIPFPDHDYLHNSLKPELKVSELQF